MSFLTLQGFFSLTSLEGRKLDYYEMLDAVKKSLGADFVNDLEDAIDQIIDDALYEQAAGDDL